MADHLEPDASTTRVLLLAGAAGAPLFVIVFLLDGAFHGNGYSSVRDTVSELSIGPGGAVQIANFVVTGILMTAFAVGLRRALHEGRGAAWGPILLGVFGVGLAAAGIFVSDPVPSSRQSWHGTVHTIVSLLVFGCLTAACFILARRFRTQPDHRVLGRCSLLAGTAVPVFFVAMGASAELAGLFQRIAIVVGWGWVAFVAIRLAYSPTGTPRRDGR